MKLFLPTLLLLLVPLECLAETTPTQFADGFAIDAPAGGAVYRLTLDEEVYRSARHADLGDLYQGQFLSEKADGIAPVVGARLTFTPSENWLINLQGQYLNTRWGNFDDYKGDLSRANAIVQYNFNPKFGIFAGYDWFKLDADKRGSDGVIGLKQEFKGPLAGVSLSF